MSERLYGVAAEFATADALLAAVREARAGGYCDLEAYAPFPVDGLAEALGFRRNRVPLLGLLGGIAGGTLGYFVQWYSAVIDYPINSGGRPLHSWPAFIPMTFALTILGAALAIFAGMLLLNGLPRLNHPMFELAGFELASRRRFFLCLRARTRSFDAAAARAFLEGLAPLGVDEVPG